MKPTIDRRGVLAALGALALLPDAVAAQPAPRFIDVHHHFFPRELLDAMQAYQDQHHLGPLGANVATWTPARTLEEMDQSGIATAIVELASPRDVWFDVDPAQVPHLSRTCNEYAAGMVRDYPGRFGFFASLPMPDVPASLAEIAYALDTLHADGIGLPTSFGTRYPGERAFLPIYEELNRRKAVVTLHPYAPPCCGSDLVPGVAESILEYPYDTARAVLSLLVGGVLARYRDIRWVLPHGGGPLPALAGRIATFLKGTRNIAQIAPDGVDYEFRRLYYDTANAAYEPSLDALLAYVPASQVLFGTDFPYVSAAQNVSGIEAHHFSPTDLAAIARGNVTTLLPELRS